VDLSVELAEMAGELGIGNDFDAEPPDPEAVDDEANEIVREVEEAPRKK
jgi:hypothetical protein